jgi:hypothetical protein
VTDDEAFEWNRICFAYADIVEQMHYMDLHIERLEAALRNIVVTLNSDEVPYMLRNRYACAVAEEALGEKDD